MTSFLLYLDLILFYLDLNILTLCFESWFWGRKGRDRYLNVTFTDAYCSSDMGGGLTLLPLKQKIGVFFFLLWHHYLDPHALFFFKISPTRMRSESTANEIVNSLTGCCRRGCEKWVRSQMSSWSIFCAAAAVWAECSGGQWVAAPARAGYIGASWKRRRSRNSCQQKH